MRAAHPAGRRAVGGYHGLRGARLRPREVVARLKEQNTIATKAPYRHLQYVRFTPGIITTLAEVDRALAAVYALG